CWSTNPNPTVSDNKTVDVAAANFTSLITGLTPEKKYYVRAYATNNAGTAYGNEVSLVTKALAVPTLTTTLITDITHNSAHSGGTIVSDGGTPITEAGVCWSINHNPAVSDSKTSDNVSLNTFASGISALNEATTYYVRAYAKNSVGIGYGNEVMFISGFLDIDGNLYHAIKIGTQFWMLENLKVTHYQNGDEIPTIAITDGATWKGLSTGALSHCQNEVYGYLYNWYAVADSRKISPSGWHVPTQTEWTTLINFLGGLANAGGKMKATGTSLWLSPNAGATNESGFTALPAGARANYDGLLNNGTYNSFFWSVTEYDTQSAYHLTLFHTNGESTFDFMTKRYGFSVRCIKD
ncbi:MAG TPA: fibrobacter succinogenes major paralogous domain-containing protein, partial [Bacteroidales bacterium]|nr:fibrobacter succinogenes major paralogous domain-containing protein [Bacteroidales bacterium]